MLFPLLRMSFPIAPSFWVLPGKHLPIFQVYSLVTSILKRLPNFPRLIDHSGFCGPFYKLLSQHLWSLFAHVFLSPYLDCELFIGKDIATVFFFCIFSLLDSVWHLLAHPCHILKLKLKKKDQAVLSWFTSLRLLLCGPMCSDDCRGPPSRLSVQMLNLNLNSDPC